MFKNMYDCERTFIIGMEFKISDDCFEYLVCVYATWDLFNCSLPKWIDSRK